MKRREFIALLGGAATAWPLATRAQQPTMPIVAYLSVQSAGERPTYLAALRKGLSTEGFVDGQNMKIEYHSADGRLERLQDLAAEIVRNQVTAIVCAGGSPALLAAKRATETIPIVFISGGDPVSLGMVSSLNRPGGNLTGIYFVLSELVGKRLALMHELLPSAKRIAVLNNPANPAEAEPAVRNATIAGRALGLDIKIFDVHTGAEIEAAFAAMVDWRAEAVFIGPDPVFSTRRSQLLSLSAQHGLAASYFLPNFVERGGLMSYGPDNVENHGQIGVYLGRILKGEKPGDLPVVQPTKYEMVLNLKTAKSLSIEMSPSLLARSDEVIE
jgi:putative ABC transport system substrate-binding protein